MCNNFLTLFFLFILMISFYLCYLSIINRIECWSDLYSSKYKNANQIIPNLFIGNIKSAKDKEFIDKKQIKVIINCSKSIPNYFQFSDNSIEYYRIPVNDSLLEEDINAMTDYLPQFVNIINNALKNKKAVLVHCHAGRQRSACLVAAYLIFKYNYTIDQAYEYIISKRKEAFHYGMSYNFNQSLIDYKKQLKK